MRNLGFALSSIAFVGFVAACSSSGSGGGGGGGGGTRNKDATNPIWCLPSVGFGRRCIGASWSCHGQMPTRSMASNNIAMTSKSSSDNNVNCPWSHIGYTPPCACRKRATSFPQLLGTRVRHIVRLRAPFHRCVRHPRTVATAGGVQIARGVAGVPVREGEVPAVVRLTKR